MTELLQKAIAVLNDTINQKQYISERKKYLPKKIRELKAMLQKAGCICEQGKGSYTKWSHPLLIYKITVSGKDGNDAKIYQEKDVRNFLKDVREAQK